MTKRYLQVAGCVAALVLFMGVAGDVYRTVMTDTAGNVISTPLAFSNNVTMNATPSADRHLARMQDLTNSAVVLYAITNITGDTSIVVTGSGKTRTLTWSNANNYAGISRTVVTTTTNYAVSTSDYFVRVNGATALTVTLPIAGANHGREYVVKNASTNIIFVLSSGGTIDGNVTNFLSTKNASATYIGSSSNWWIK